MQWSDTNLVRLFSRNARKSSKSREAKKTTIRVGSSSKGLCERCGVNIKVRADSIKGPLHWGVNPAFCKSSHHKRTFISSLPLVRLMIDILNVSKTFGTITALSDLTLHVGEGELFGLVGPNGAGKTTGIRIVCGILHPTQGRVLIDGRDVFENIDIKRRIGYLPEEPNLYTRPTAFELLQYFGSLYGNSSPERIDELLTFVGLHHRRDSKVETFSKGMRQRLSFARALVHDPDILILDEPTMGLDPATARRVRQFIKTFKGKKTIILCTHYMEEADELCDRVGFLDRGRIVKEGEPLQLKEELKEESVYEVIARNDVLEKVEMKIISREGNRVTCSLSPEDISFLLKNYPSDIFSIRTITPTLADVFERYTHGIQ